MRALREPRKENRGQGIILSNYRTFFFTLVGGGSSLKRVTGRLHVKIDHAYILYPNLSTVYILLISAASRKSSPRSKLLPIESNRISRILSLIFVCNVRRIRHPVQTINVRILLHAMVYQSVYNRSYASRTSANAGFRAVRDVLRLISIPHTHTHAQTYSAMHLSIRRNKGFSSSFVLRAENLAIFRSES